MFYSYQVINRVLGSGNLNTLLWLSMIMTFVYAIYALLQIARSYTLIKVGEWIDIHLSPIVLGRSISSSAARANLRSSQLLRDLQTVKTFLTSTGINTLFDAPWSLIYIVIIFLIHPSIGFLTVGGGIIIVIFALFNAIATNKTLGESTEFGIKAMVQSDIANRNAEVIEAMGMIKNVTKNWNQFNMASLDKQSIASYRNGVISNFSRYIRNIMSMAVTGISAYLIVVTGGRDMNTGGMIMASIMVGRALAPFDNAIEMWKSMSSAMKSYKSLNEMFNQSSPREESMIIPTTDGLVTLENIYYAKPSQRAIPMGGTPEYILKGVSFAIQPGEVLGIIGPSASGKSTLAKIIMGIWEASSGSARLDGAEIYNWNRENFGTHVGYLPQGIELFSGTIKQNIARMSDEIDPSKVIEAAKMVDAHEMILKLPEGYETDIGVGGANLSGGQRQRVGLARAFYGNPKLILLDEPNSNLDELGENALAKAIKHAKEENITVVVIAHRPAILSVVDKILLLQNGAVAAHGSREEIQTRLKLLKSGSIV
jgi:ATP-binding cassette subfamily C protein